MEMRSEKAGRTNFLQRAQLPCLCQDVIWGSECRHSLCPQACWFFTWQLQSPAYPPPELSESEAPSCLGGGEREGGGRGGGGGREGEGREGEGEGGAEEGGGGEGRRGRGGRGREEGGGGGGVGLLLIGAGAGGVLLFATVFSCIFKDVVATTCVQGVPDCHSLLAFSLW